MFDPPVVVPDVRAPTLGATLQFSVVFVVPDTVGLKACACPDMSVTTDGESVMVTGTRLTVAKLLIEPSA